MDTACLRIKFQPLIHKKTISNSKCCLEIVPEVYSIQNLDKLIWRKENNLIEYTIPMTYKVVLQKRDETTRDDSDTTVKTYYSCVDLLLTSSNSMHGCLGSGDVSKVISDTLIFKKCLDNCTCKKNSIHGLPDERKHPDNDLVLPISHDTTHTILQLEDIEKKQTETNVMDDKEEAKTKRQKEILNINLHDESLDKITNTENVYPIFGDTEQNEQNSEQNGNVVLETVTAKSYLKHESTRCLSLSPICSVNTHDTPLVSKIVSSKSVTCKIHESQRDLVLLGSISIPSDLSHDNQALSKMIDINRQTSPKKLRLPPEMRFVEYMRFIESEILPLKIWFNDIKRKCTALGIEFSKQPSKQCMTISTVSTSSGLEMSIPAENTKSNRAVYKIVFAE